MRGEGNRSTTEVNLKIREAFAILSQGVEMILYDTRFGRKGQQVLKLTVWMDSDILRLCADKVRPTLVDRAIGKVAPGLYMRDISEVREGDNSQDFKLSPTPPLDRNKCMSLVGSERSLCLEMPSKFARDWFLERIRYVVGDILTDEEKRSRFFTQFPTYLRLNEPELEVAQHLQYILLRGMEVLHHHPSGVVLKAILSFDQRHQRLLLTSTERGFFGMGPAKTPSSTNVVDIAEVRAGSHSIGFVRTGSTDKSKECLSVVSSGQSMDLELPSCVARDVLVDKLRVFTRKLKMDQMQRSGMGGSTLTSLDDNSGIKPPPAPSLATVKSGNQNAVPGRKASTPPRRSSLPGPDNDSRASVVETTATRSARAQSGRASMRGAQLPHPPPQAKSKSDFNFDKDGLPPSTAARPSDSPVTKAPAHTKPK